MWRHAKYSNDHYFGTDETVNAAQLFGCGRHLPNFPIFLAGFRFIEKRNDPFRLSVFLSLSLSLSLSFISLLLRSAFIFRILSAAHSIRSDRRIRLHSRFGIPANIIEPNPIRVTIIYGEMTIGINNQGKSKRLSPIEYERRGTRGTCKFQSDRSGKKSHAAPS